MVNPKWETHCWGTHKTYSYYERETFDSCSQAIDRAELVTSQFAWRRMSSLKKRLSNSTQNSVFT